MSKSQQILLTWEDLDTEETESLSAYQEWAGVNWQVKLMTDWFRAGSPFPGAWGPLQKLRNRVGNVALLPEAE